MFGPHVACFQIWMLIFAAFFAQTKYVATSCLLLVWPESNMPPEQLQACSCNFEIATPRHAFERAPNVSACGAAAQRFADYAGCPQCRLPPKPIKLSLARGATPHQVFAQTMDPPLRQHHLPSSGILAQWCQPWLECNSVFEMHTAITAT